VRSDRLGLTLPALEPEESGAELQPVEVHAVKEEKRSTLNVGRDSESIDLVSNVYPVPVQNRPGEKELPRKEVIQPHLPVRLPCYDFVPIAGSALDGSLSCELGHRLQAYPTFMT
jgi:hypothetical protein